ncbi:MAG TPA: adenine deaminase C-terminal domain-containing protein, partial [Clostridia bacterium]|nr:adenine deaminase C-terminal domain-containing protein [Clostridia bacterium]
LGILSGLGLVGGAIASTVAHDSHNLIVAGDNDRDMLLAVNALELSGGGYVAVRNGEVRALLPLPIAGLMTDAPLDEILSAQRELLFEAKSLGILSEADPFITLSFLALPVIPEGRLTERGVFQVSMQRFL